MARNLFAIRILSIAFAAAVSFSGTSLSAETGDHYTHAQLKQLTAEARTPDQYSTLARYFGAQHDSYMKQAVEEKQEWDRRSRNVSGILAKYPRPVDSARNLYEYYMYKATEAGALQAKYNLLANPNAPLNVE
jgi:hypothetical protein